MTDALTPETCPHIDVTTFGDGEGGPRLWACAECRVRFYPACLICVDVGHRNEHDAARSTVPDRDGVDIEAASTLYQAGGSEHGIDTGPNGPEIGGRSEDRADVRLRKAADRERGEGIAPAGESDSRHRSGEVARSSVPERELGLDELEHVYRTFSATLMPTGTLGRSRTRRPALGSMEARQHLRRVIDEYRAALREPIPTARVEPTGLVEGPDLVFSTSPAPDGIDTDAMFLASPDRISVHVSRKAINAQVARLKAGEPR